MRGFRGRWGGWIGAGRRGMAGTTGRKVPYFKDWVKTPKGVFAMGMTGLGFWVVGQWGLSTYRRYMALYAENKLVQQLQAEASEQAYYRFLYAQLARQVLDVPRIADHMGELRFSPDTMKPFQFPKDNQIAVIFNVYGTRRVGLVYVLMNKSVNSDGLPVYTPVEFTVDAWDGRVFRVPTGKPLDFSVCYNEVLRQKNSKREARLLKAAATLGKD